MKLDKNERGLTVLEGIILLAVAVLVVAMAVQHLTAPTAAPGGMVVSALDETGGTLVVVGDVYGYVLASGSVGDAVLSCDRPDPGRMGSVSVTVGLLVGDMGAVDMERAKVTFSAKNDVELLQMTTEVPVRPQNWTILKKFHMIPGKTADGDALLEPGEQFELLIYPARSLAPYDRFVVTITALESVPLPVSRTVPPGITQVMDLG